MKIKLLVCLVSFVVVGCASITNRPAAPVRFETVSLDGEVVEGAECKVENNHGNKTFKSPSVVMVRRSSKDLLIECVKEGHDEGKGVSVSRANAGMFGNIIAGGVVGAIIDHNVGTAYTYPQWIRIVMGKTTYFDRKDDQKEQPNLGTDKVEVVDQVIATTK